MTWPLRTLRGINMSEKSINLIVALDGTGWHPSSWRESGALPREVTTAKYWKDLAHKAESGFIDAITLEDSLGLQSEKPFQNDARIDQFRGRLDAVQVATFIAPSTKHIGIIPTVIATHTEPFHISKAIATIDYVSRGRAGLRVQLATRTSDSEHFGRREFPNFTYEDYLNGNGKEFIQELFDEAAGYIEVVRRLWDSWEDDAEIRDTKTGKFIDINKLHYIDFKGKWFNVKGPSITQRPPQGQPLVTVLAHATVPYELAAQSADLVYITPTATNSAESIISEVRAAESRKERTLAPLQIIGELVVFLGKTEADAKARKAQLDSWLGHEYQSDAQIFVGSAEQLADVIESWSVSGIEGFRLRPASLPYDLNAIVDDLVPVLQRRGIFRSNYGEGTLRERFGFSRPENRYATSVKG